MSTPEKPRPSLDDTLRNIEALLTEQLAPPGHEFVFTEPSGNDAVADVRQTTQEAGHLPGAPGPTCPGCAADAARPGWLARALHRLFGDGAP